jgi:hypothetical protein
MPIDVDLVQWAAATFVGRGMTVAQAEKTGAMLDNVQELLPWLVYKQGRQTDLADIDQAIRKASRQLSLAQTRRPLASGNAIRALDNARQVEESLRAVIAENIAQQDTACLADRAVACQVRNSPAAVITDVQHRSALPE